MGRAGPVPIWVQVKRLANSVLRELDANSRGTPRRGRLRAAHVLATTAFLLLGQLSPTLHALADDHADCDLPAAALTAECSLCELHAARSGAAPLPAMGQALVAPVPTARATTAGEKPRFDALRLGPNAARAPPFHV